MIELAFLAGGAVLGGGVAHVAHVLSLRSSGKKLNAALVEHRHALADARRRGEDATAALRSELVRMRAVVPSLGAAPIGVGEGRATPVELARIVQRVRGFSTAESVVIGGSDGLPRTRIEHRDEEALATLATLAGSFAPATAIELETSDARHFALRALPRWTRDAWLAAGSLSRPPSPAVLDAAIAFAALLREPDSPPAPVDVLGGELGQLGPQSAFPNARELEHACATTGAAAMLLVDGVEPMSATGRAIASLGRMTPLVARMAELRQSSARRLRARDVLRLDVHLPGGDCLTYAPLAPESERCVLAVTRAAKISDAAIARLAGRLRLTEGNASAMDRRIA